MGYFEDVTGLTGGTPGGTDPYTGAPIPAMPSNSLQASRGAPAQFNTPQMPSASLGATTNGGGSTVYPYTQTPTGPTPEEEAAQQAAAAAAEQARIKALQDAAYTNAVNYGTQQISDLGINPDLASQYGVLDAYNALLDQYKSALDPTNENPAYATTADFQQALDTANTKYTTDLRNQLNQNYGNGFEYTLFPDTADDAILQAIIDQQKTDAQGVLDRAHARGQLNDVGYSRAETDLGNQGKAAMSTLQSIGGGVIADDRNRLTTLRDNALTGINNATLSSPYSLTPITDQLGKLGTELSGSLENDIYRDLGSQKFFDPSTAISTGGNTQGTINPSKINFSANPLLSAFLTGSTNGRKSFGTNSGSTASTGTF